MDRDSSLKYLNGFALSGLIYYRGFIDYLENNHDYQKVWQQISPALLQKLSINQENSEQIINLLKKIDLEQEYRKIIDNNVRLIIDQDEDYPEDLKHIYNPPKLIYYKGIPLWKDFKKSVAIVGTRHPSPYGSRAAAEITKDLVDHNFLIISGLATGIDSIAHRTALDNSGNTAAVIGNGLDVIYPKENFKLYEQISTDNCLLSEYPLGSPSSKWHFPQRNRIISGLAKKVIVIEGSRKSGSLITAKMAMEQNREVYALPGSVYSTQSSGPNFLIQTGAKIITSINDIIDEQDSSQKSFSAQADFLKNLSTEEKRLYQLISETQSTAALLDNLYENSGYQYDLFNQTITSLELKGLISRLPGQRIVVN